jgi:uncharacterized protein (DUF983 family)
VCAYRDNIYACIFEQLHRACPWLRALDADYRYYQPGLLVIVIVIVIVVFVVVEEGTLVDMPTYKHTACSAPAL